MTNTRHIHLTTDRTIAVDSVIGLVIMQVLDDDPFIPLWVPEEDAPEKRPKECEA